MLPITKKIDLLQQSISNLYFVGDIHGGFEIFKSDLDNIENAIVVICGDVGLGFHTPSYYEEVVRSLQTLCEAKNIYICCVRGNHDNPHYFKPESLYYLSPELVNNFNRVIFVKDYDIIMTKFGNILAVGGGISIDRTSRNLNTTYWANETVLPLTLDDFSRLIECNIDMVVSHTAPTNFAPSGVDSYIVNSYQKFDKMLKYDLAEERSILDSLFIRLLRQWRPSHWYYGHYHASNYGIRQYENQEIQCFGLDCSEFKQHISIKHNDPLPDINSTNNDNN